MDVAGDNQLNVEHEMIKQRLSPHGRPIGVAGVEIIGEVLITIYFLRVFWCKSKNSIYFAFTIVGAFGSGRSPC